MRFEGFAGNGGVKRQLSAAADSGRLPHALLIEGEPGTGRRTLARLLARTFVCQAADSAGKPCGECPACRKALDGSHPDIEELGGEGGYKSFHIDVIRALRGSAQVLPNEAPVRVMILLNAQDMTPAAQNALLKLLEEPPAALRFILTADNRAALLPTVLSRCQCVALRGVEEREAVAALKERLAAAAADASAAEESGVPSGAGKAGRDKSGANKAAPPLSADDETLIRAVRLFGG
ncbi:MAG: DNA polymerase III subunit delta, partial [Oscillospiraceae bacterium]|nr:DNA polymerase III subunit delta [Oscillospiraceae bacterium]